MGEIKYNGMSKEELVLLCAEYEKLIVKLGGEELLARLLQSSIRKQESVSVVNDNFGSIDIRESIRLTNPGISQVQVDANQYMMERFSELESAIADFSERAASMSGTWDANLSRMYEEAVRLQGRVLAEFAVLSEVIAEKDEKSIKIRDQMLSFNGILRQLSYLTGLTSKTKKELGRDYGVMKMGYIYEKDGSSDLFYEAISEPYVEALLELKRLGFISVVNNRQGIVLTDGVRDAGDVVSFLKHYYGFYLPVGSKYWDAEWEKERFSYAPRHQEYSKLDSKCSDVVGNVCSYVPKLGKCVDRLYNQKKAMNNANNGKRV